MKIKSFLMLAKASVSARKFNAGLFCLFITLASAMIFASVSIAFPLAMNIETKINNHILNRELNADFLKGAPKEDTEAYLEQIRKVKHVVSVYQKPNTVFASDSTGKLGDTSTFDFVHNGYEIELTDGRLFKDTEAGTALAPDKIHYYNPSKKRFIDVDGKELLGKTISFKSEAVDFDVKVVGVYNTADKLFENKPFLIPRKDLLRYSNITEEFYDKDRTEPMDSMLHYIIEVDNHFNLERAQNDVSKLYPVEHYSTLYDDNSTYNLTVILSFGMLVLFIAVVAAGLYMFLQNGVKARTSEIALYRSIGYKSNHLFLLLFSEYFILGFISILLGAAIALVIDFTAVNSLLFSITGGTLIETKAALNIYEIVLMLLFFTDILRRMSNRTVKKTENSDLTILMKA